MGARDEETIDLCSSQESQDSETGDDTQELVAQPSRRTMHPHAAGPPGCKVAAPPHKIMTGVSGCAPSQSSPYHTAHITHAVEPPFI
jgi:hypothetical protein